MGSTLFEQVVLYINRSSPVGTAELYAHASGADLELTGLPGNRHHTELLRWFLLLTRIVQAVMPLSM